MKIPTNIIRKVMTVWNFDPRSESRVYAASSPRFAGEGTLKRGLRTVAQHFILALLVVVLVLLNGNLIVIACGPTFIEPVFKYSYAPENPFENFAAGKFGLIKPTQHRVVLFAAYRYLNGGDFSADEQRDLVEVWNSVFKNQEFSDNDLSDAVKDWVKRRKAVFPKEENAPDIYTERTYGGYEFFPNCTKNAFETAAKTLDERAASYGSDDKDVREWLAGQDKVFTNCASGRQIPDAPNGSMPEWLQKDREYQLAAADFYSMHYDEAKNRFSLIAADANSPWQETAQYLVGRTLIRKASAVNDESQKNLLYTEAEQNLQIAAARGGKYATSAQKLIGLVKFRLRPQERVGELARELSFQNSNNNLRQDLIDYSWLLDKFEKEGLEAEERRLKLLETQNPNSNFGNSDVSDNPNQDDGQFDIYFTSDDNSKTWIINVATDSTDEEAFAEAEKAAGSLTEKMKSSIREGRQMAYASRYRPSSDYPGGYHGSIDRSLSHLSNFLRQDDLTDWLFTFQIQNEEAYLYSLNKFKLTRSDIWLMTAISKADTSFSDLKFLLEAAGRTNPNSRAFHTIAYHHARILILQNKHAEAKKFIDSVLSSLTEMTISARNEFFELRVKLVETLDDYLKFSQLRPFTFSWDGSSASLAEVVAERKSFYDPEYDGASKDEFERKIDLEFKNKLPWDQRMMFDYDTVESINKYFDLKLLVAAERSAELPDYLKERFVMAIWTRALLLEDFATANKVEADVLRLTPEIEAGVKTVKSAKTATAKKHAVIYLLLKNPILTPFVVDSMGRTDNEINPWDINDWWCAPYEYENEEYSPKRPAFITDLQANAAALERKKLISIGDGPVFLGKKVLSWQKIAPQDKRIPESLYIVYEANGWTKYACGNNEEIRNQARDLLLKKYPKSDWARRIIDEESEN